MKMLTRDNCSQDFLSSMGISVLVFFCITSYIVLDLVTSGSASAACPCRLVVHHDPVDHCAQLSMELPRPTTAMDHEAD